MSKRYRVFAIYFASQVLGEVEAENEDEAIERLNIVKYPFV